MALPASAWFSSFFGRKRFFMVRTTIFTLASLLCGTAPTLGFLIFARVLQGAGGGTMQSLSQSILESSTTGKMTEATGARRRKREYLTLPPTLCAKPTRVNSPKTG
jgi:DHA2 family multidrug resistance protein